MTELPLTEPRLCPHCGNVTPQEKVCECSAPQTWYDPDGTASADEGAPKLDYRLLRCQTCHDLSLYSKLEVHDWDCAGLDYPSDYDLHPCIPQTVSMNYREAKRVQKMSPNAFAVLLRRALEAVCDDRGVAADSLARRLKELSNRGEIPGKLADITTVLRELGNAGAHHTKQRVTVPLTWTMDAFFRTLVEYVYVAPHKLLEFQNHLKLYEAGELKALAKPPSSPTQPGG